MERNNKVLKYLISFTLFAAAALPAVADGLVFSITEWDTGLLEYGIVVEQPVSITNETAEAVSIDLISTCSCMTVNPESIELPSGETGGFTIVFDSHDDEGDFEKLLIIQTDSAAMPRAFLS